MRKCLSFFLALAIALAIVVAHPEFVETRAGNRAAHNRPRPNDHLAKMIAKAKDRGIEPRDAEDDNVSTKEAISTC